MEKQSASLHLASAFLAMEPTNCVMSHARSLGGGSVTVDVQRFIWDHCISRARLVLEIESNCDDDENAVKENVRALKYISFLFPD
ncbi:hypothetical protein ACJRO7_032921, partial [Eucalyptus globulus]